MKKIVRVLSVTFSIFILSTFTGCRSTQVEDVAVCEASKNVIHDSKDKVFKIYEYSEAEEFPLEGRYIFIRLYQPYYDNPFCVENFLNNCIKFVDVSTEFASHAAIGFSLDDNFYGLTSSNKNHNLEIESCTYAGTNEYMRKCNPYKSVEITYVLKVTDEEYENVKAIVEGYYNNPETKYDVSLNMKIAGRSMKRKFFWPQKEKSFAVHNDDNPDSTFEMNRYNFVCSSFIAYVLANSVQSIHDYFVENQIDSNYVVPSDIQYFPGMKKLFKTTWVDYNIGAKNTAEMYVAFAPYYHEQLCQGINE